MRAVTWNMNKRKHGNWEWLMNHIHPDYALVQEASPLPRGVKATTRTTTKKQNLSAFYSETRDHKRLRMPHDYGMGLLVAEARGIHFINVYANLDFKPVYIPLLGLLGTFISRLKNKHSAGEILIAGDFNMDRRMDDKQTGSNFAPVTNDFFDALLSFGFHDCMRKFSELPVQTHRHNRSKFPWELDHMFATPGLYERLDKIEVINVPDKSDHDLIVADFQ